MSLSLFTQLQRIWDYHLLNQPIKKSDAIFVLCSYDLRVAEHAAQLYLDGFAPLVIFSGAQGRATEGLFTLSEAETFANVNTLGIRLEVANIPLTGVQNWILQGFAS